MNARYPDGIDFRYEDRALALEPELPGATVHLTLDGTAPSAADPVYTAPIPLPRPTLVRAAIVRDDGTLGRAKPFLACDLLDGGRLAVVAATDSDPRHPAAAVLDGTNWTFWLTAADRLPFPHEIVSRSRGRGGDRRVHLRATHRRSCRRQHPEVRTVHL